VARRALAFDYGLKAIGVAVGQTLTGTATPLGRIAARDGRPDWHAIARTLEAWQPDLLVVGQPLNMDGSPSEMSRRCARFARQLEGRFGVAAELFDERLSSREALERVRGERPRAGKADAHGVAAQVILEGWLAAQADDYRAER